MATEYYQAIVRWIVAGQRAENVFMYRIINPTEPDEWLVAQQLGAAMEVHAAPTDWLSRLRNLLSDEAFLSSISIKRVAPTGGNTAVAVYEPTDVVGNVAFPVETQQNAACIIWVNETTADITGRNFIPGTANSEYLKSRWKDTFETKVGLFIATHLPGFSVTAGHFDPVIYNRDTKVGLLMTNGYLSQKIGTQRRREVPV